MTLKSFTTIALAAAIVLTFGLSAPAHAKPLASTTPPSAKTGSALLCTANDAVSSLHLQSTDQDRLELARAFRRYLEAKGQDSSVVNAIYKASLSSGVDFELLLLKAMMESDMGHYTVAARSSARGLFQYIEPTWLVLMKRYGAEIGYPHYAEAIGFAKRSGLPYIKNKNSYLKAEILALRYDDDASAMMKALQIQEETDMLRSHKGGRVNATDHYISHMLGLPLTKELYELRKRNSIIAVARLNKPQMREAAKLNRPFFYNGKNALNAKDVYKKFDDRVSREFKNIYAIGKTEENTICTAENTLP